jgi:hypothetical protein
MGVLLEVGEVSQAQLGLSLVSNGCGEVSMKLLSDLKAKIPVCFNSGPGPRTHAGSKFSLEATSLGHSFVFVSQTPFFQCQQPYLHLLSGTAARCLVVWCLGIDVLSISEVLSDSSALCSLLLSIVRHG